MTDTAAYHALQPDMRSRPRLRKRFMRTAAEPVCDLDNDHHDSDPQRPSRQNIRGIVYPEVYAAKTDADHRHCDDHGQDVRRFAVLHIDPDEIYQHADHEHARDRMAARD